MILVLGWGAVQDLPDRFRLLTPCPSESPAHMISSAGASRKAGGVLRKEIALSGETMPFWSGAVQVQHVVCDFPSPSASF
mgnify:CR=1 FL=1